jgi:hypothetical protein
MKMAKLKDILSPSFGSMRRQIRTARRHPTEMLWRQCLSIGSTFCESVVNAGLLSWEQMVSSACRYCLGATKNRGVIYWQIDLEGRVHDGKVMYYGPDCHRLKDSNPTWVSALLAIREHRPKDAYTTSHCFFGLHLLTGDVGCEMDDVVAVVEAEKSAVILSEIYPQYIWLAAGGLGEVQADKFRPLRGRKVVLFPDTDPGGKAFDHWFKAAEEVMQSLFWEDSPPIRVSGFLEQHASEDQKRRKIDLVDFLKESGRI